MKSGHTAHSWKKNTCSNCGKHFSELENKALKQWPSLKYFNSNSDVMEEKINAMYPCITKDEALIKDIIT